MKNNTDIIRRRIRGKGRGWVCTPKDFMDVAQHMTVNTILSRLAADNMIIRLDQGIYYYPAFHDKIGMLSPSSDKIARAIAARSGMRIFMTGAKATNMLGFSTQVEARVVYATNSPSRTKVVNGKTIQFQKTKVPILHDASNKINAFIQSFSYLGKRGIDSYVMQRAARLLSDQDFKDLKKVFPQIPAWMADIILKIQQVKDGQLRNAA